MKSVDMPQDYYFKVAGAWCFHMESIEPLLDESPIDDYDHGVAHIKWTGLDGKTMTNEPLYHYTNGTPDRVIGSRRSYPFGFVTQYDEQESYTNWLYLSWNVPYHDYDWDYEMTLTWGASSAKAPSTAQLSLIYEQLTHVKFESSDSKGDIIKQFCANVGAPIPDGIAYRQVSYRNTYGDNTFGFYRTCEDGPPTGIAEDIIRKNSGLNWTDVNSILDNSFYELLGELKLDANNIASFIELIELVKGLKRPLTLLQDAANAVKALTHLDGWKDAWLKYRYVYNTTKADIEDFSAKLDSITSTARDERIIRASFGEPVNTHIKLYAVEDFSQFSELDAIPHVLRKFGLYPDAYTMWDMVPFSFIADWFLPIGDNLEKLSQIEWKESLPYRMKMLVSHKGSGSINGWSFDYYYRYEYHPSDGHLRLEDSNGTWRTWVKRGLDVFALL